ncbi:MAG TPA: metallophosphoesterase, partial [Deltaproteobacteria bacterium]|nr:metallophosphoesterase [Deltaproteobacteria bacterium]
MSAFGIVFTLLGSLMHGYVFWRAASVPGIRRRISRAGLVSGAVALWLVFLLGRAYRHGSVEVLAGWLQTMGMTWMAMLFLMTVCLLAVEVVTGFGLLLSGPAKRMRGMALVAGVVLSLIAMVQGTRARVVEDDEGRLEGRPGELDGTVIVGLSDLHLG